MSKLLDRIRQEGGERRAMRMEIVEPPEERVVIESFRAERSADEYAEVCPRILAFFHEIDSELVKRRTTYAELEESEADLDLLRHREIPGSRAEGSTAAPSRRGDLRTVLALTETG